MNVYVEQAFLDELSELEKLAGVPKGLREIRERDIDPFVRPRDIRASVYANWRGSAADFGKRAADPGYMAIRNPKIREEMKVMNMQSGAEIRGDARRFMDDGLWERTEARPLKDIVPPSPRVGFSAKLKRAITKPSTSLSESFRQFLKNVH